MSTKSKRSVLITGTSEGGIGSSIAFEYQKRGYTVFATARNTSKIDPKLIKLPGVEVLSLDVVSRTSIQQAVKDVASKTGGTLDVLVNNAGLGYAMPLLDMDESEARKCYDINVWGLLAMSQEFFPLIRKCKGTIVNMSSIVTATGVPLQGIYNSSKSAVDALSEGLRLELEPFGVRVVTYVTGKIRTEFFNNMVKDDEQKLPEGSVYKPIEKNYQDIVNGERIGGPKSFTPVDQFAQGLVSDVESGKSGRVWRGSGAWTSWFARTYLPTSIIDGILSKMAGLNDMPRS